MKKSQNRNGSGGFINSKQDEVRESGHGFAADVFITDGGSDGCKCNAVKILFNQISKAVTEVFSLQVIVVNGSYEILSWLKYVRQLAQVCRAGKVVSVLVPAIKVSKE